MSPPSTPTTQTQPQTPRIYLEPLNAEKHLQDFHAIFTSPEAVQWSISPPATTIQESRERIEKILTPPPPPPPSSSPQVSSDEMYVNFAVMLFPTASPALRNREEEEEEGGRQEEEEKKRNEGEGEKEGDKMIGIIGTNRFREQGLEVGYCFNIEFWGKGYATEALRLFLAFMWRRPGMF